MPSLAKARATILFCIFVALNSALLGQGRKWGKVDPEHLKMTVYERDSSAAAVKLFDEGQIEVRLNEGFEMVFTRHYQIKLLKESAKSRADIAIVYWHEDKVSEIKAQTILPGGKSVKIKKSSIFTEKEKNRYKVKKFTLPQVVEGAVIEVKYRLKTQYIFALEPWVFQGEIPTIHSGLTLILDPGFSYGGKIVADGQQRVKRTVESFRDLSNGNRMSKKFIYSGEYFPAIKDEPFISTLKNYRARLDFQIRGFEDGYNKLTYIKDFPTLCKEMMETDFGLYMKPSGETKKQTAEVVSEKSAPIEKAEAIYNFARDGLEDESYFNGIMPRKGQNKVLKDKKASASERNLFMIAMLRAAGVQADPLLISTRGHGWVSPSFPFLNQFNRTLALVEIDGGKYILDASDKFTPFGKLPPEALVKAGLLVRDDSANFIKIPVRGVKSREVVESLIFVGEDGKISGKTRWYATGYASRRRHMQIDRDGDLENVILDNLAYDPQNFSVDSTGLLEKPAKSDSFATHFNFSLKNYAESIGDEVFLRPSIFFAAEQNLLVSKKRDFPVEFGYLREKTEINTFQFPASCAIPELPKPILIRNSYITYRRIFTLTSNYPNALTCTRYYKITKDFVPPGDYDLLRNAFARIVDADQEPLVITLSTGETK